MNDVALTLEWMVDRLANDRATAWAELRVQCHRSASRLARRWRLQGADVEDVGDTVLLRAVVDDYAALRRGDRSAPLAAWLTGVARNVIRERLRDERGRSPVRVEELPDRERSDDAEHFAPDRRRIHLDDLTRAQRSVVAPLLEGLSERRVAMELGITRDRVHDVKRRAMTRLRSEGTLVPEHSATARSWATAAARFALDQGDEVNARVLELFAVGVTRAQIARQTGLTIVAVKERRHRRRPGR